MIRFFDASALVKRYVREPETPVVRRLLADRRAAVSRLSEAEVSSALARRKREGDLDAGDHAAALSALRADLERLDVVELVPEVVARVHELLARHALRAGDALQLAAAIALRVEPESPAEFVCWDDRLRAAASAEGFVLLPDASQRQ